MPVRKRRRRRKAAARAASGRRARRRYTDAERSSILATANQEGLTAKQVQKRFGVAAITYYSWRKKAGAPRVRRGRRPGVAVAAIAGTGDAIGRAVREQIRDYIRAMLPEIIRSEVGSALGGGRPRRGRRAK